MLTSSLAFKNKATTTALYSRCGVGWKVFGNNWW